MGCPWFVKGIARRRVWLELNGQAERGGAWGEVFLAMVRLDLILKVLRSHLKAPGPSLIHSTNTYGVFLPNAEIQLKESLAAA